MQQGDSIRESVVSVCDSREEVSSMRNGDGMENDDRMDGDWGCDSDGQDEGRADGGGSSGSRDEGGAGETESTMTWTPMLEMDFQCLPRMLESFRTRRTKSRSITIDFLLLTVFSRTSWMRRTVMGSSMLSHTRIIWMLIREQGPMTS